MIMRSGKRIVFDFVFLSFHVFKWVLGLFIGISAYRASPGAFWVFIFLFLGMYILQDLYRVFKAIIKDTTIDSLDSQGEYSYVKGFDPKDLTSIKIQALCFLTFFIIGVVGIPNNVNQWRDDGQNRFGNIAISSFFVAGPVIVLVSQARKRY